MESVIVEVQQEINADTNAGVEAVRELNSLELALIGGGLGTATLI